MITHDLWGQYVLTSDSESLAISSFSEGSWLRCHQHDLNVITSDHKAVESYESFINGPISLDSPFIKTVHVFWGH